jgi:hypothetical protein
MDSVGHGFRFQDLKEVVAGPGSRLRQLKGFRDCGLEAVDISEWFERMDDNAFLIPRQLNCSASDGPGACKVPADLRCPTDFVEILAINPDASRR